MKRKKQISIFIMTFIVINCFGYNKLNKYSAEIDDNDGKPHPVGSFNYSKIADHPRLLINNNDLKLLKSILKKNTDLAAVHSTIIDVCNKYLDVAPVERIMTGHRLLKISREAEKRIFYLSYAYRLTGNVKYLERAESELLAVCNFSDWNPKHFLDVGEMAAGVAIGYDWLYNDLRASTRQKIREALETFTFKASEDNKFNWFLRSTSNWNSVCNAGVTYAALATYESNKIRSVEMIERCLISNKLTLDAYGPDGNYAEGYGYWLYGTEYETLLFAGLESALGSDFDLHKTKGFMESAQYMLYMEGPSGFSNNYSDSNDKTTPLIPLFWYAKKNGDISVIYNELKKLQNGVYIKSFEEDRLLPTLLAFAVPKDFKTIAAPKKKVWSGNGVTPVILVRSGWGTGNDKYVTMKGGKAVNSHSHMDAGAFIYESQGVRWAMDFGVAGYSNLERKGVDLWTMTQKSQRWDVFRLSNKAHNTLTINDQRHLIDGNASILEVFEDADKLGGIMDLTPVYKDYVTKVNRKIILKGDDLNIEDIIATNTNEAKIRWTMATPAKAEILQDGKTIKLTKNDRELYLKVDVPYPFTLQTWSTTPTTDYDPVNPGTILVGFETILPPSKTYNLKVILTQHL